MARQHFDTGTCVQNVHWLHYEVTHNPEKCESLWCVHAALMAVSPALVCITQISQGSISKGVPLDACALSVRCCKPKLVFCFAPETLDFGTGKSARLSPRKEPFVLWCIFVWVSVLLAICWRTRYFAVNTTRTPARSLGGKLSKGGTSSVFGSRCLHRLVSL